MDQVLQHLTASGQESKTTPRRMSLYCDTLVIAETVALLGLETFFCNITARQILFSAAASGPAIQMRMNRNSRLLINSQTLPEGFRVEFTSAQGHKEHKAVSIPEGAFGVSYTSTPTGTGTVVMEEVLPTGPDMELQAENWMSLINEDGTLKTVPFTTE